MLSYMSFKYINICFGIMFLIYQQILVTHIEETCLNQEGEFDFELGSGRVVYLNNCFTIY